MSLKAARLKPLSAILDVALLTSARRSSSWLEMSPQARSKKAESGELRGRGDAEFVAHNVVALAEQAFELTDKNVAIRASVGIAFDFDAQGGWKNMLNQADAMAYEDKEAGRSRSALFERD